MLTQLLITYINRRKNVKKSKYKAKGGKVGKMGGGMIGFKKTSKYKAKGGVVGKKNGGGMKMSKYRANGGIGKKRGGGKMSKYRAKGGRVK